MGHLIKGNRDVKIPIADLTLPDRTVLELFRSPRSPDRFSLVSWRDEALFVGTEVNHSGRTYVPVRSRLSVTRALRLPSRVAPRESTQSLFSSLKQLIAEYLDQPEENITKIVFAVFASWLADALAICPVLWIVTPTGSPRHTLVQLLDLVCRRSLVLAAVNRASLRSLPMNLHPTLLLCDPDPRPSMQILLNSSSRLGIGIPSGHDILDLYGPKIVFSQTLPRDTALETEALRFVLMPSNETRRIPSRETLEKIGEEFQARFLGYRLRNRARLRMPKFETGDMSSSA